MRRTRTASLTDESSGGRLAQSEVLGVVLLLGITVTAIGVILTTGIPTLNDAKEQANVQSAVNVLNILDGRVSSVTLGSADKKKVSLELESGTLRIRPDAGNISIYTPVRLRPNTTAIDATGANHTVKFPITTGAAVANETLDELTVEYPETVDISDTATSTTNVEAGFDTDTTPGVEETIPDVDVTSISNDSRTLRIEFGGGHSLNRSDILVVKYQGVNHSFTVPDAVDVPITVNGNTTIDGRLRIGPTASYPGLNHTSTMGKVEYAINERRIGYQGGGIWLGSEGNNFSTLQSPPDLNYDGSTLTMQIINITNDLSISAGSLPVLTVENDGRRPLYPRQWEGKTNPVNSVVYVTIEGSYYQGWASYFDRKTAGTPVGVNDTAQTALLELTPITTQSFDQAIVAHNGSLLLENASIDSYSTGLSGGYDENFTVGGGDVYANQTLFINNSTATSLNRTRLNGDGYARGEIVMQNRTKVVGSLHALAGIDVRGYDLTATCPVSGRLHAISVPLISAPADCQETDDPTVELPEADPPDQQIRRKIESFDGSAATLPTSGSPIILDERRYVVNDSGNSVMGDWDGDRVIFNNSGGPIEIALDSNGCIRANGATFDFEGTQRVTLYRGSTGVPACTAFRDLDFEVPDNRTDVFRIRLNHSTPVEPTQLRIQGASPGAEFYGTVYGPDNDFVFISGGALDYHGAVIGGEIEVRDADVHYDQSLRDPSGQGGSRINFLHVSDHKIRIE